MFRQTTETMKEIRPTQIDENAIKLIARDWMLVTGGDIHDFNTMTASWGMLGEMWGYDVAETVVRPQRYTNEYIARTGRFTLSFFKEDMRPILSVMGTKSGRDIDKMHYPGLEAIELPSGQVAFKEAKLIIDCDVIYCDRFSKEAFKEQKIVDKWYADDFHYRYIGKINHVYIPD